MRVLIITALYLVQTMYLCSQNTLITGTLVDTSNKPVDNAAVKLIPSLTENNNSIDIGTISDIHGNFAFNDIEPGTYFVEISHLNYELYFIEIHIKQGQLIDLKTIILSEKLNELNEIVISGKKLAVKHTTDKITINVSRNVIASGGTATDILKQIPAVTVSVEGNISIRGKNDIDILIDGKPSGIVAAQGQNFLSQLDLSTVEKIEIITNPSVAKSVSGAGGVINIIMKKNSKNGVNGSLDIGYGSDDWYHFSPDINYKTGAFNLFMDYTYRHRKRLSDNSNTRDQIVMNSQQNIDQRQNGERLDKRHSVELGLDYYLNENEYITLSSNYSSRDKDDNQTRSTSSTINSIISERRIGHIQEPETNEGWGATAQYNSNLSEKKKLSIVLDYVHSVEDEIILREEFVSTEFNDFIDGVQTFYIDTNDRLFLDLEYKIKANKNSELLYGAQGIYRTINQTFNALEYNNDNDTYENIIGSYDEFNYKDFIAAIYSQYKGSAYRWSFEAALRLEVWDNNYRSQRIDDTFRNNYIKFFPSLKIGYDFTDDTNITFSIKKGLNRPSPNRLNPFPNISNAFNISVGNPDLDPEIFYNIESGVNLKIGYTSITSGLFYTLYNNMIQRVTKLQDNGVTLTTPININNMYHYGLDVNMQTRITKWLSQQLGALVYKRSFEDDFIEASEKIVYQVKSTTNFEVNNQLEAQLFGSYNAPENTPQGAIEALYFFDAGVEFNFWKNKARLSIVATDIFNTLKETTTLNDQDLNVFNNSKINTRRLYMTFRYKF